MTINSKVLDELLADYKKPEDMIGENGLLKQLTKALLERALQAELTGHLGYEKHDPAGHKSGNSRTGTPRSSRRSWSGTRRGGRVLTTRSCLCIRAGCRRARFRDIWKRSTK